MTNFLMICKVKYMQKCKECKFYKQIDAKKGDCFGHEVLTNMDITKCPQKAFQPKM